jgi:hypothetical protein
VEIRTLTCTTWLDDFLDWPGVKQVFRLERIRRMGETRTVEVVYGLTSRPQREGSAKFLLRMLRSHWAIENRLHYVRDVTMGEDQCRVRRGHSAEILAGLRNVVNQLTEHLDFPSKAAALRRFAAWPFEALRLILNN